MKRQMEQCSSENMLLKGASTKTRRNVFTTSIRIGEGNKIEEIPLRQVQCVLLDCSPSPERASVQSWNGPQMPILRLIPFNIYRTDTFKHLV